MGDLIVITVLVMICSLIIFKQIKKPHKCGGDCSSCHGGSCHVDFKKIAHEIKK